jgi:hypothetical protein
MEKHKARCEHLQLCYLLLTVAITGCGDGAGVGADSGSVGVRGDGGVGAIDVADAGGRFVASTEAGHFLDGSNQVDVGDVLDVSIPDKPSPDTTGWGFCGHHGEVCCPDRTCMFDFLVCCDPGAGQCYTVGEVPGMVAGCRQ